MTDRITQALEALKEAVKAEPVEMIAKWRVLELISSAAPSAAEPVALSGERKLPASRYLIDPATHTVAPWEPTPWMVQVGESASANGHDIAAAYKAMLGAGSIHPAVMAESPFIVGGTALVPADIAAPPAPQVAGLSGDAERKFAEQSYVKTAFSYPEAPIGSRDWCLFWDGWQARALHSTGKPDGAVAERVTPEMWKQLGRDELQLEQTAEYIARMEAEIAATADAPVAEPVGLCEVGFARDTDGTCIVTVNGREVIRDNGDIVSHYATLDWLAGEPRPPAPEEAKDAARKPLTDEQIGACINSTDETSEYGTHHFGWYIQFARAIESAHGITGGGA